MEIHPKFKKRLKANLRKKERQMAISKQVNKKKSSAVAPRDLWIALSILSFMFSTAALVVALRRQPKGIL